MRLVYHTSARRRISVGRRFPAPENHFHYVSALSDRARRLAGVIAAVSLCPAAYWSVRLSCADWFDRQGWPDDVRRASQLAPGRADLRARLEDWQGAVARNPYDAASWIRLGLEAEAGGNQELAEHCLLRAAEADRLFEPRWSLANYYFRRHFLESFWTWAERAAGISRVTPVALFRLCREITPDLGLIFDRLVSSHPQRLEGFLYWAQTQNDLNGLGVVAGKAVELAGPDQSKALVACASQILEQGNPGEALRLWNRMVDRRLLPFNRLDPAAGASLTNGDFHLPPGGETFNWALPGVPGVSVRYAGGEVRFEFSGRQPEQCEVLAQWVPVLGGHRYRLSSRYRTTGIAGGEGLRWHVENLPPGPPLEAAGDWTEALLEFESPPQGEVIRLALAYQRTPGTTRITGLLRLENVRLELAPQ